MVTVDTTTGRNISEECSAKLELEISNMILFFLNKSIFAEMKGRFGYRMPVKARFSAPLQNQTPIENVPGPGV